MTTRPEQSVTRRERVTQLGDHDVYFINVPIVIHVEWLHALADELGHPRPIWPPEVIHDATMRVAWDARFRS